MIISPAKITSSGFSSKMNRCYFGKKRYWECFLMLTLVYVWNEIFLVPTWKITEFRILQIGIPIWWVFNSGILLKSSDRNIPGIWNGIGILLPRGVPEIGTKNWKSQPSLQRYYNKYLIQALTNSPSHQQHHHHY